MVLAFLWLVRPTRINRFSTNVQICRANTMIIRQLQRLDILVHFTTVKWTPIECIATSLQPTTHKKRRWHCCAPELYCLMHCNASLFDHCNAQSCFFILRCNKNKLLGQQASTGGQSKTYRFVCLQCVRFLSSRADRTLLHSSICILHQHSDLRARMCETVRLIRIL